MGRHCELCNPVAAAACSWGLAKTRTTPGFGKRSTPHAITIFKSVGTALEDLVASELSLGANQNRAQRESAGFGQEP
jgi:hypothetical protein